VLSVPAPGRNNAVITVKTGGVRTGLSSVGSLAGVTLGLYTAKSGGSAVGNCTSDSDGDCSFTVTGSNLNKRYWVRQTGVPAGYFSNLNLGTGDTVSSDSYAFQTPARTSCLTPEQPITPLPGVPGSSP
jgi:hypothetical protein